MTSGRGTGRVAKPGHAGDCRALQQQTNGTSANLRVDRRIARDRKRVNN
jgi:hypothetical protein